MILKYLYLLFCYHIIKPFVDKNTLDLIKGDFKYLCEYKECSTSKRNFIIHFIECPEFRSIIYYRLRRRLRLLPIIFFKPQVCCYINSKRIKEGLMLMHGFSTIINAKEIGKRVTIFQQVTIGYSHGFTPVIGDDTVICCGAKIIGNITIGNNCTVGAGAVVVHDVPDNAIVAGNPAKVIRYNNKKAIHVLD